MSTQTAPVHLDQATARRRLGRIRDALAVADGLLVEAYTARDWQALGHASWAAYCAAELPELQLIGLRREPRDARVVALSDAGLSIGAIADALGVGKATAHRALAGVQRPETSTATDGRQRRSRAPRPAPAPVPPLTALSRRADQLLFLIAAAGPAGRTCAELREDLRLHHGAVSGALSPLARRGLVQHAGTRGGYGVYVVLADALEAGTVQMGQS